MHRIRRTAIVAVVIASFVAFAPTAVLADDEHRNQPRGDRRNDRSQPVYGVQLGHDRQWTGQGQGWGPADGRWDRGQYPNNPRDNRGYPYDPRYDSGSWGPTPPGAFDPYRQYPPRAGRYDRGHRGWGYDDGYYYCRPDRGTSGMVVGGIAGGVLGGVIAPRGSKALGAVIGAASGAAIGRAVDRGDIVCR